MVESTASLLAHLRERRHARLRLPESLPEGLPDGLSEGFVDHLGAIWEHAACFFALPQTRKQACHVPGQHTGYRRVGLEYSQSRDRPDMNESFSYRLRTHRAMDLLLDDSARPLYDRMANICVDLDALAQNLLGALARDFGITHLHLETALDSYLQINHYRPSDVNERVFLQEPHEDGHLFTLVTATAPGLEICADGEIYEPTETRGDELLVMPGSVLTLLTGGQIEPLYHRVRRHADISMRMSLMYFVNPNIDQALSAWVQNRINDGVDIARYAAEGPKQFGLPSL